MASSPLRFLFSPPSIVHPESPADHLIENLQMGIDKNIVRAPGPDSRDDEFIHTDIIPSVTSKGYEPNEDDLVTMFNNFEKNNIKEDTAGIQPQTDIILRRSAIRRPLPRRPRP